MDEARRQLDEPLEEEAVTSVGRLPEALPCLVGLEEPPGPELLETSCEEGVGPRGGERALARQTRFLSDATILSISSAPT